VPADLTAFYGSDYYSRGENAAVGYANYDVMAEFGVAWAAQLVRLLTSLGRVFEVNPQLASETRSHDIEVIADDIFDPGLEEYSGSFDVVSGLAVFEHVRDIRRAVETAAAPP
jgi:hypothetical protein